MAIQKQRDSERYTDFYVNVDIHPTRGDLTKYINEDSVKRSIRNIIFTDRYERFFQPDIGVGIKGYLFENVDSRILSTLENEIIDGLRRYEPRADVLNVKTYFTETDQSLRIDLVFRVINNREPVTINIIINRVR